MKTLPVGNCLEEARSPGLREAQEAAEEEQFPQSGPEGKVWEL